jgi:tRNA pseudouridine55 synthase
MDPIHTPSSLNGLLLVDKPKGWTSFDVVAKVRGQVKQATGIKRPKVGHTGTLDPLATGLLVLTIGTYCKRAQEFSKLDKVYEVEMTLGQVSTTDDAEGELTPGTTHQPTFSEIATMLQNFTGDLMQVPPQFSAIKIDGQRAYKMARAGQEVKIEPRPVKIYEITEVEYTYPVVKFTVHVSSGTYVRSLVRDVGEKLGTGAYMSELKRTEVGKFSIEKAITPESVDFSQIMVV